MAKKEGSKEELTEAIPARVSRKRKHAYQEYLAYLRLTRRIRVDLGLDIASIDAALSQGQDEFAKLADVDGRIVRRKHPKIFSEETCTVYIDECGSHTLSAKEKFKAFALAAVIIPNSDEAVFDALWKQWKRTYLGSEAKLVHEPDVRKLDGSFWCGGDASKQKTAIISTRRYNRKVAFCCDMLRPTAREVRCKVGSRSTG